MPLFGSGRDASFVRRVNKEIIHKVLRFEVDVYKLSEQHTQTNIYDESVQKTYYNPIRLQCLLFKDDTLSEADESGLIEQSKDISFVFLRDDLTAINLVLQMGDIIKWDEGFYEVGNIKSTNYWINRNPSTYQPFTEGRTSEFGYSVSITAESYRVRINTLNIVDVRSGTNDYDGFGNSTRYL